MQAYNFIHGGEKKIGFDAKAIWPYLLGQQGVEGAITQVRVMSLRALNAGEYGQLIHLLDEKTEATLQAYDDAADDCAEMTRPLTESEKYTLASKGGV